MRILRFTVAWLSLGCLGMRAADTDEERAILHSIQTLFDGMAAHDAARCKALPGNRLRPEGSLARQGPKIWELRDVALGPPEILAVGGGEVVDLCAYPLSQEGTREPHGFIL